MSRRGLSYEEAIALGLGDEHPDAPKYRKAFGAVKAPGRTRPRVGEPNKTEARYGAHLGDLKVMDRIDAYAFEPFKLRLAGRTWLRIDYAVKAWGNVILIDVKGGPIEDDAAVKLKVCAEKYPWLPLYLAYYERGSWIYRAVTTSGIGGWCPEPF